MKPLIAITQRVAEVAGYPERRDALDQRWSLLLEEAGFLPLLLPNQAGLALELVVRLQPQGLVLTGGNSLVSCGGDAPERDETESALLEYAFEEKWPVLAICRGMQLLLSWFDQPLVEVKGHVAKSQKINFMDEAIQVNSYHTWGCYDAPPEFDVLGRAYDGVVKAVRHQRLPLLGIMWHPERLEPFRDQDLELIRQLFGTA